jgi:hypothetical protein
VDFYLKREEQEQAEEAQRKREAEARAAQERYRRETESGRQAAQQRTEELRRGQGAGQAQPSPLRSRRGALVGLGVLGAVVVVGLFATLTYSLWTRGGTIETSPQPAPHQALMSTALSAFGRMKIPRQMVLHALRSNPA